jgi:hypothetical protein
MSYNTHQASTDLSYITVLLLLAYVMSSAPRYLREFRQNHQEIKIEKASSLKQVLKIGKYYTVDPYIRVWNRLSPAPSGNTLVAVPAPASR